MNKVFKEREREKDLKEATDFAFLWCPIRTIYFESGISNTVCWEFYFFNIQIFFGYMFQQEGVLYKDYHKFL